MSTLKRTKQSNRLWTFKEDTFLKVHYPDEGVSWVAERLNRSIASVGGRVSVLGLHMTSAGKSKACSRGHGLGSDNRNWRGYSRVGVAYVKDLRHGAKRRGITHPVLDTTLEHLQYLDSLITEKCPLSGLPLTFPKHSRDRRATASLDRIDATQGYVRGNVRWVHKDINRLKWDLTDEVFLSFVRDIAKTWPR